MHSGTSTIACTRAISSRISGGSTKLLSAYRGSSAILFWNTAPELTSSTIAPQATCSSASRSTVEKSPASSSRASALRPRGVDALADDAEGLVETDDDGAGARFEDGAGHAARCSAIQPEAATTPPSGKTWSRSIRPGGAAASSRASSVGS